MMKQKEMHKNKISQLRLETNIDFRNYYSLSFVIGLGVLASIAMFIGAISYHEYVRRYQFSELVNSTHDFVGAQLQTQDLQFNILRDLSLNINLPMDNISSDWIGERISSTKFSCFYYVVWDNSLKKVESVNRGAEDEWCKKRLVWPDALLRSKSGDAVETLSLGDQKKRNYFAFTGFLSKISKNKKSYMIGFLPHDNISVAEHSDYPLFIEFSNFEIPPLKEQLNINPSGEKIAKIVFLDGSRFQIQYSTKNSSGKMVWPWITLFLGFVITGLISYFYLKLMVYSTQTAQMVKEKTFELQLATQNAVHANESKSKFLASVSHDVRTPLNLMLGMSELLTETDLDAKQLEYVSTFSRAGYHLLELINGVLDISRIESGELIAKSESVTLPDLIANVVQIVSGECRRKKLNFSYNIETSVPRHVIVDGTLLRQVLLNLLFNSMKFTPHGEIQLNVQCIRVEDNKSKFIFIVKDTGEGIPEEDFKKIFEAFHQSNPGNSDLGVGLGLSIVKSIVNHLGGEVKLDSQIGNGSTFRVELQLSHELNESWLDRHFEKRSELQDKKVFLYCHTDLKQHFIKNSLEYLGCSVTPYLEGENALRSLKSKAVNYDYIIIDLVSNTIGGLELLKLAKLKKSELSKVFIMCPLVHRKNDIAAIEQLGIENIVFKPVNLDVLIKGLAEGTTNEKDSQGLESSDKIAREKPLNIIVAEDDLDNRILISHYLRDDDVNIHFAKDGSVALQKFTLSHQDFDLILTDLQMPRMDGFQLIKHIRKFEDENGLSKIPIIVLTADAQRDQIKKLETLGASEYLTKPITKSKLKETLVSWS